MLTPPMIRINGNDSSPRRQNALARWQTAARLLCLLSGLLFSSSAFAYPFMLRHEYATCSQCHVDPSGGSTLTAYGRAQSEVLLRTPYEKRGDDWEPSSVSNFLWGVPTPEWLLLGGDVRGAGLLTPVTNDIQARAFPMQLDVTGAVAYKRLRVAGSLGFAAGAAAARPASIVDTPDARLISRQHWVGVTLGADDQMMIRAGRMNLPFGLRNPEHTSWVRAATRTDINEAQQHGVTFFYAQDKIRAEGMAIIGNLQMRPAAYWDTGYSAYAEYAIQPKLAVGISSLLTHASKDLATTLATFHHAHGLFGRYAPWKMLMLSTEWDLTILSPRGQGVIPGLVGFLQADLEPIQGLHVLATGETKCDFKPSTMCSTGVWGGVAWFLAPHFDLRLDVIQRWIRTATATEARTQVLAQLHFFL